MQVPRRRGKPGKRDPQEAKPQQNSHEWGEESCRKGRTPRDQDQTK